MDFKQKYLKYKEKYIALKKKMVGGTTLDELATLPATTTSIELFDRKITALDVRDKIIPQLNRFPGLTHFNISHHQIGFWSNNFSYDSRSQDEIKESFKIHVALIQALPITITHLGLAYTGINGTRNKSINTELARLVDLQDLDLGGNYIDDEMLNLLPTSIIKLNLRSSYFVSSKVDQFADRVATLIKLKYLDISNTHGPIRSGLPLLIANLPKDLEHLSLENTFDSRPTVGPGALPSEYVDSCIAALRSKLSTMINLKHLDLSSISLTGEKFLSIISVLPLKLSYLGLSHNNLSGENGMALATRLPTFTSLQELVIYGTNINNDAIATFNSPSLKKLNLMGNYSPLSTLALGSCLSKLPSITELNISHHKLNGQDIRIIGESISPSIEILNMEYTGINDEQFATLLPLLSKFINLKKLDIEGNKGVGLDIPMITQFMETIVKLPKFEKLYMKGTGLENSKYTEIYLKSEIIKKEFDKIEGNPLTIGRLDYGDAPARELSAGEVAAIDDRIDAKSGSNSSSSRL